MFGVRADFLRRMEDALTDGIELLGADRPAGRRLRETQEFLAFMRAELPALQERWREHQRRA